MQLTALALEQKEPFWGPVGARQATPLSLQIAQGRTWYAMVSVTVGWPAAVHCSITKRACKQQSHALVTAVLICAGLSLLQLMAKYT
jgi:hypothetical protein